MTEQPNVEDIEEMRIIQAAVGQWMVAMRDWQLWQDEVIESLVKQVFKLEAEVARLSIMRIQQEKPENALS